MARKQCASFSISALLTVQPKKEEVEPAPRQVDLLRECFPLIFATVHADGGSNATEPKKPSKMEDASQDEEEETEGRDEEEEEDEKDAEMEEEREVCQKELKDAQHQIADLKLGESATAAAFEGCPMLPHQLSSWLFPVLPPPLGRLPPLPPPFLSAGLLQAHNAKPGGHHHHQLLPAHHQLLMSGFGPSAVALCAMPKMGQHHHHHHQQQQHKRKGGQIRFSNEQTDILEGTFDVRKYLSNSERKKLARALDLSERQVKTWFQNRRAKWRRQLPAGADCRGDEEDTDGDSTANNAMLMAAQNSCDSGHHFGVFLHQQN